MSEHEVQEERIPNAVASELAILTHLLVNGSDVVRIMDVIQPADFYRPANGIIFDAVLRMYRNEIPVDLVTVSNFLDDIDKLELVGGRKAVSELALDGYAAGANLEYHAEQVRETSTLRQWWKTASNRPHDMDELRTQHRELGTLAETSTRHVARSLQELLPDEFTAIAERAQEDYVSRALVTGHADVDRLTSGFEPKDLIVIAGRPSMGKTSFCLDIIGAIACGAQRAPSAMFSLEMPQEQIRQKFIASQSRISTTELRNPKHFTEAHWDKVNAALATYDAAAKIHIADSGVRNVMDIEAQIARMNPAPAIVFIDHLGYLEAVGKTENRVQAVGQITRDLKALAKKLDVPMVLLCQLSRGVESRSDKRPMMSDLRESGDIEQNADQILFLYRDDYYNQASERPGECEIILAKNRLGETGTARLGFLRSIGVFYEIDGESTAPADNVTSMATKSRYATGGRGPHPFKDRRFRDD